MPTRWSPFLPTYPIHLFLLPFDEFFPVLPVSTYQYLRYLPVLSYQYSPVPADRHQVQPQEAAVQPLQVAVQQVPADRRQVQPLLATVHPLQQMDAIKQTKKKKSSKPSREETKGEEKKEAALRKSQITPALELSFNPPVQCSQPALRRDELTACQAKPVQYSNVAISNKSSVVV